MTLTRVIHIVAGASVMLAAANLVELVDAWRAQKKAEKKAAREAKRAAKGAV